MPSRAENITTGARAAMGLGVGILAGTGAIDLLPSYEQRVADIQSCADWLTEQGSPVVTYEPFLEETPCADYQNGFTHVFEPETAFVGSNDIVTAGKRLPGSETFKEEKLSSLKPSSDRNIEALSLTAILGISGAALSVSRRQLRMNRHVKAIFDKAHQNTTRH